MTDKLVINSEDMYHTWTIPTKQQIENIKNNLIAPILNGNVHANTAVVVLRAILLAVEAAEADIKQLVIDEISKYPKGQQCTALGAKLDIKEVGVKYDYSSCNDDELNDLLAAKADIDKKVKERQEFLRKLQKTEYIANQQTGEIQAINPPIKSSTTTYIINFKND